MTRRLDPARDWEAEVRRAALLRLQVEVLAVDVAAFFEAIGDDAEGAYAARTARRFDMVVQTLSYVIQRAEHQLAKVSRQLDGAA